MFILETNVEKTGFNIILEDLFECGCGASDLSCDRLQVHDHEGVLARRAVAEAHLQAAGGGPRPGSVHDLHRRESGRTTAQRRLLSGLVLKQTFQKWP